MELSAFCILKLSFYKTKFVFPGLLSRFEKQFPLLLMKYQGNGIFGGGGGAAGGVKNPCSGHCSGNIGSCVPKLAQLV